MSGRPTWDGDTTSSSIKMSWMHWKTPCIGARTILRR